MGNPAAGYSASIAFLLLAGTIGAASATPLAGPVTYNFQTIDAPGSPAGTQLTAINNNGGILGGSSSEFLYSGGVFSTPTLPAGAIAYGINDAGHLAGILNGNSAFLDAGGVLTTLNDPDAAVFPNFGTVTQASGVNNKDQVVGVFEGPGHFESFLYDRGNFTTIADPQAYFNDGPPGSGPFSGGGTFLGGINDSGTIVGSYTDITGTENAFVLSGGTFTTINDPLALGGGLGGLGSNAGGINDNGDIVGSYYDALGARNGFLDIGGTFTTIDFPDSGYTTLYGINDAGQIVGSYLDADNVGHGFLATPIEAVPEVATWVMLLTGFGAIGFSLRRSRQMHWRRTAKLSRRQ